MYRLTPQNRLALLMHDAAGKPAGKMGYGLLRYGAAPVVAVVDRSAAGQSLYELTGIPAARGVPIVASVREALAFAPDVLVPAIAPPGGNLPAEWRAEVADALDAGLSVANGLHTPLGRDPDLAARVKRPGQFLWDIRQEPEGLMPGGGRAREVPARRVLFVGTDMNCGKMTAALELTRALSDAGVRARFLATGQIGIAIAGEGVALDAVRVDYASGAIEQMVLKHGYDHDVLLVEGQGSLLNPASTATLPLLRGAMPTHLILVHRAGQETISRADWVPVPPLRDVIGLYEAVAAAAGALPAAPVVGVVLNTSRLGDADAAEAVARARDETGLPATDVVRFGPGPLLDAVRG